MEKLKLEDFGTSYDSDDCLKEELHEMLVPAVLREPWTIVDGRINLYFYHVSCVPIPEDRDYRDFGIFLKYPLPKEAETMQVDLHLARGRIVKTRFVPSGMIKFHREEILLAQNFQEMFLKVILDRSELFADYVSLGGAGGSHQHSSTFYLLLPVKQQKCGKIMIIDWTTVERCLSSPVFKQPTVPYENDHDQTRDSLKLLNGTFNEDDVLNSLVFTPHNKRFFFITEILHKSIARKKRSGVQLSFPDQPLLKAKQLFNLHNLLHNRVQESTGSTTSSDANPKQSSVIPSGLVQRWAESSKTCNINKEEHEPVRSHQVGTNGLTENGCHQEKNGALNNKSAKSQLFEICALNYWSHPSFVCCKDEGPSHVRKFTFKVTVQIEGSSTLLECYGKPKSQKKSAQEDAAAGALWYLKHLGYT
ncbi:endoribonuclease Dicer-like protein 4-like isoform X1 [Iris pallida]|uniref:Endoribonuclease Dicer-like protein 4-like isoform X1 n=1 Tax=Iris pallida TaxID=29817 RepID=A0AAX6EYB2_IRIPA|nr:endoribonuclease Dicer-like protein 4-like isoform X1 [Iris pallida]